MKPTNLLRALSLSLCVLCVAFFTAGCSTTGNLAEKFKQFESLGVTEATITGKFSNTDYKVETKDGTRRAELEHSNPWLTKVRIVRESPAQ